MPPAGALELLDFHVFHGFTGRGAPATCPTAEEHEAAKDDRYPSRTDRGTRAVPFSLVPFVFNSYGGLGPRGLAALKRWGSVAQRPFDPDLLPQLALAATKRVAAQVLSAAIGRGSRQPRAGATP